MSNDYDEILYALREHHPLQKKWEMLGRNPKLWKRYVKELRESVLVEKDPSLAKIIGLIASQHLREMARNAWLRKELKSMIQSEDYWRAMAMAAAAIPPRKERDERITSAAAAAMLKLKGWEEIPEAWDALYFLAPTEKAALAQFKRAVAEKVEGLKRNGMPERVAKRIREIRELE